MDSVRGKKLSARISTRSPPAFGMLLLVIVLSVVSGMSNQNREWKVKYKTGTGLKGLIKEGTKMTVTLDGQAILFRAKKGPGLVIPPSLLTGLSYDNVAQRRLSTRDLTRIFKPSDPIALVAAPLFIGTGWALGSMFKQKDHCVNIFWQEQGVLKEAVFELGKKDYRSFLDQLQGVSGQTWENLPQARENLLRNLEARKDEGTPLELDRRVSFDEVVLRPGLYQLVFLPEQEGTGFLYFFPGKKVKADKIQAVVAVEMRSREDDNTSTQIIYSGPGSEFTSAISEIRIVNRTFRFSRTHPQN